MNHDAINEEVKQLVDEALKNNLIRQSFLDAIRGFNIKLEKVMNQI